MDQLPHVHPLLGIKPVAWACALTGILGHRVPNQRSHFIVGAQCTGWGAELLLEAIKEVKGEETPF